jgi:hypothetical protein
MKPIKKYIKLEHMMACTTNGKVAPEQKSKQQNENWSSGFTLHYNNLRMWI